MRGGQADHHMNPDNGPDQIPYGAFNQDVLLQDPGAGEGSVSGSHDGKCGVGTLGSFQAGDYTGFGADADLREPGDGPQQLRGVDSWDGQHRVGAPGSLHVGDYMGDDADLIDPGGEEQQQVHDGDGCVGQCGVDAQGSLQAGNMTLWVMMLTIEKTTGVPVQEESSAADATVAALKEAGADFIKIWR